jgi:uncharacterized protein YehS (DUF1456 family)
MIHNDVLSSVRYMLNINDVGVAKIIELGGRSVPMRDIVGFMRKEDDEDYVVCPDAVMDAFLNGLVTYLRGPAPDTGRASPAAPPRPKDLQVTNNTVLKKLRVAFELKEDDVLALMNAASLEVSKHELRALFRGPEHPNFRACGDQFLRNFLKSLTARVRS